MTNNGVLHQLRFQLYTRLKPSPLGGIGVFAIRDIPANTEVFAACKMDNYAEIPDAEIHGLHPAIREYVKDFFVHDNGVYHVPSYGPVAIDQSYYLNHSKTPNLRAERHGEVFVASRYIHAGEELTADYDTYDDRGL